MPQHADEIVRGMQLELTLIVSRFVMTRLHGEVSVLSLESEAEPRYLYYTAWLTYVLMIGSTAGSKVSQGSVCVGASI